VLFDRDGTLNVDRGFIRSAAQIELYPGTGAALRRLREAGFRLAILTNQPVLARGEATEDDVAAIHRRIEWKLGEEGAYVDGIYVCPHHPDRGFPGERSELKIECDCRKPATGLFDAARRELDLDPARSWMIGDTTRDIELARRAGLRSILVLTGQAGRDGLFPCVPDYVAKDVVEAAAFIRLHTAAEANPTASRGALAGPAGVPR
jgi:histidinol-phosphate phosphatase family protein